MVGRPIIRAVNKIGDIEVKVGNYVLYLSRDKSYTLKLNSHASCLFVILGLPSRCKTVFFFVRSVCIVITLFVVWLLQFV